MPGGAKIYILHNTQQQQKLPAGKQSPGTSLPLLIPLDALPGPATFEK